MRPEYGENRPRPQNVRPRTKPVLNFTKVRHIVFIVRVDIHTRNLS